MSEPKLPPLALLQVIADGDWANIDKRAGMLVDLARAYLALLEAARPFAVLARGHVDCDCPGCRLARLVEGSDE